MSTAHGGRAAGYPVRFEAGDAQALPYTEPRPRGGCGRESVIGPEHVPIWTSERNTLLTLIDTPGLPPCRKKSLQRELSDVEAVLHKTDTAKEQT